jgi:hypothetical protein
LDTKYYRPLTGLARVNLQQASSRSRRSQQPVEAGNNRTKEDRLSQRWLVGKDPVDLVGSFPAFGEVGSNHAAVVHLLG